MISGGTTGLRAGSVRAAAGTAEAAGDELPFAADATFAVALSVFSGWMESAASALVGDALVWASATLRGSSGAGLQAINAVDKSAVIEERSKSFIVDSYLRTNSGMPPGPPIFDSGHLPDQFIC
jgi:hypothetical protein